MTAEATKTALERHKPKHPAYRVWQDLAPERRQEKLDIVLARVVNDEKLEDIAKDMSMSRSALNMALLEYAEGDWKKAQVARAQSRLDRARADRDAVREKLDKTDNEIDRDRLTLTLARVRDDEKSAQWELEKLNRRLYGQDGGDNSSERISINLHIGGEGATNRSAASDLSTVIDVTPTQDADT